MNTECPGAVAGRALALLGGSPAFPIPRHVGRPNLPDRSRFHARIDEILDRNWLTNAGPATQEFEDRVAGHLGVRHAVAVANGTLGLELTLTALGLEGEVILPSFTFVATAHAVLRAGLEPVFADVEPGSHCLDARCVESLIGPRTSAIIGVHLWGTPCDVEALQSLADRYGLELLFDAAHAYHCSHDGRRVGCFGHAEVFSFHATKFVSCGEGGVVTTNDSILAQRLRLARNFGFTGVDSVVSAGTNAKLSELQAALGLCMLDRLPELQAVNARNHALYSAGLRSAPGLRVIEHKPAPDHNFQYMVLEVDSRRFGLTRDEAVTVLQAEGVLARRYFAPGCHRMAPYSERRPLASGALPVTEALCESVLALPTGEAMSPHDVRSVCALLVEMHSQADRLRPLLADPRL